MGEFAILTSLLLSSNACQAPPHVQEHSSAPRNNFTQDDKRIARALSMGSEAQKGAATAQHEAALCNLALETIAQLLQDSDSLSSEQRQAFQRAQNVYRGRVAAALDPAEREKTRKDVEAAYPDQSDRARVAMGCLRALA